MSKVAIYGDISPNVIDGSSIWLMSISTVLSRIFDEVHLQLKMPLENRRLITSLDDLENVVVHEPNAELSTKEAASAVEKLNNSVGLNAVVVRGFAACNDFAMKSRIAGLTWAYITDVPFPPTRLSDNNRNRLERIAARCRRLFAQTDAARSYLEAITPQAAGKVEIMSPMIPDSAFIELDVNSTVAPSELGLIYSGKFAEGWKTLEMLGIPQSLEALGVESKLTVIGDKYNRSKTDPSWLPRMQEAIRQADADPASRVNWLGALSRDESIEKMKFATLGLGWRSSELDSSLELSTKALEYGAVGVVPVINKTQDHLALFGEDYPFFVSGTDSVCEVAKVIASNLDRVHEARLVAHRVAKEYSMASAAERLEGVFQRAGVLQDEKPGDGSVNRVLIASHDMKFMGELMDHLSRSPSFEVDLDHWETLHKHDANESKRLARRADTIFCEWAGPSLAWYSHNKPKGKKLVSRLHRFELDGPWMSDIDWDNVDAMIFVSELYRRMALEQLPLKPEQCFVIPNAVDSSDFNRPKLPNARFTLGFVGMVPWHKRPDRALDLLERLLEEDDRYTLRFKGRMPWEYPYEWNKAVQKQLYLEFFKRIAGSTKLRQHVVFDPFGADIASWQRSIGFILSPSEVESFHMAPAEGMSARSVPIFWSRPGVEEIFGSQFLSPDLDAAVEKILKCRDLKVFESLGEEARESVLRWDPTVLMPMWEEILSLEVS